MFLPSGASRLVDDEIPLYSVINVYQCRKPALVPRHGSAIAVTELLDTDNYYKSVKCMHPFCYSSKTCFLGLGRFSQSVALNSKRATFKARIIYASIEQNTLYKRSDRKHRNKDTFHLLQVRVCNASIWNNRRPYVVQGLEIDRITANLSSRFFIIIIIFIRTRSTQGHEL